MTGDRRNPPRHRAFSLACLLALVAASAARPAPATDAQPPLSSAYELAAVLMANDGPDADRAAAAAQLVRRDDRDALQVLRRALEPDAPPAALHAVLIALSTTPLPPSIEPALLRVIEFAPSEEVPLALRAIASSQSRAAAAAAIPFLAPDAPEPSRTAAIDALLRITARDDLARDPRAWLDWWSSARFLSEPEWRARLAESHARRAERLTAQRADLVARLVQTYGRLHAQTPADQRPALLASLIRDDLDELRFLGLDLASRALLNGQRLDDDVARAALDRLSDSAVDTRIAAARLLENLAPEMGVGRVIEALSREDDPRVAGPLLRLIAARPNPVVAHDALRWLATAGAARQAASQALLALHAIGSLPREVSHRALETLRAVDVSAMQPSTLRLLGALGDARDREALAGLLTAEDRAIRLAAADGLVAHPAGLQLVLDAAHRDPDFLEACVRGVLTHRPDSYGFEAVFAVVEPGSQRGDAAVARLITALPLAALADAASRMQDPQVRDAFITRVLSSRNIQQDAPGAAAMLAVLARARLDAGQPAAALAALDQADQLAQARAPERSASRLAALIALERFSDCDQLAMTADAWLDAAESLPTLSNAQAFAAAFKQRFQPTDSHALRLTRLAPQPEQPASDRAPSPN